MDNRMKTTHDYQLEYLVIIKQSPDGQPFWPIPNSPPPTIDACRQFSAKKSSMKYYVFLLPGQHNVARGDLLINIPSIIGSTRCVRCSWCNLVEYVSVDNTSCLVVAKEISCHDVVKLPDRIYLTNDDFIKLHKPNPIDDLDAFVTSLTTKEIFLSHPFAVLKKSSDGQPFWLIPSPLPFKAYAYLVWESVHYHLFCLFEQHNIACGDLLIGKDSSYYLVKQVSIKETSCFVFTESVDVVKLPDRIYLENDFFQLNKPKSIDDLAEFVASLTIEDVFAKRWSPKNNRANIYIFRDADVIFYVGSSANVYDRIRAHLGIKMKSNGHFELNTLVEDNLPDSRNWNIDLYRVTNAGDLIRREMQIIKRLCPIINVHGNPCPTPLPMRYKWRMDDGIDE